jgi:hypothetical protein
VIRDWSFLGKLQLLAFFVDPAKAGVQEVGATRINDL